MRDDPFSPAVRLLGWAVHGTFLVLLAIALARVTHDGLLGIAAGGALLGLLYLAAIVPRLHRHRSRPALARAWLGLITVGWAALALSAPDFVWLAFPLFFAYLHLLPLPAALPGVAVLTGAAVAASAWHGGGLTLAEVLGPCIGAAVATMMALAYRALYRESEQRRLLIDDLVRTRERLVRAEADAARHAERERLAREIHDTLAQGMSSIILLLRAARRDLDYAPGAARGRLDEAEKAAAENLEEARSFVRALAPPVLRRSSLTDALRRVTESAGARSGAAMRFEVSGTPQELPTEYEVALLRIAQGALGNAARHAAARNVGVTLTYLDDMVVLDVFDDGRGFAPARTAPEARAADSPEDGVDGGSEDGVKGGAGGRAEGPAADSRAADSADGGVQGGVQGGAAESGAAESGAADGADGGVEGGADGHAAEDGRLADGRMAQDGRLAAGCAEDGRAGGSVDGEGTGYGLRAMRDRARAVGGTLTVESAPGEGTAVVASLPLPVAPEGR